MVRFSRFLAQPPLWSTFHVWFAYGSIYSVAIVPKRTDIESILIIGAGPIVIGQACEFDYSGTQATRALKEEGYRVILVNSNPATIMTDPNLAHRTYIEPITTEYVAAIIEKEKPDAILPTVGGQTALNLAMDLHREGVLQNHNVQLIGAQVEAIEKAENRERFKETMDATGIETARGGFVYSWQEAETRIRRWSFLSLYGPALRWAAPAVLWLTTAMSSGNWWKTVSTPALSRKCSSKSPSWDGKSLS